MRFRTAYGKTFAVLTRQMLYKHIVRLTGLSHKKNPDETAWIQNAVDGT